MTEPIRSTDGRTPRWSAHIHESLDAHEAQAAELRRELQDLRRTLEPSDAGPAIGAHRQPGRRRLRRRLLVLAVLVVLAAAAGLAVFLTHRGAPASSPATPPTPGPSASAASSGPSAASTAPVPSAASTVPSANTVAGADLPPWPGGAVAEPPGLPTTGPGADTHGSEVTVALDPDRRHVEVYERALIAAGTGALSLRPAQPPPAARSLVTGPPVVQDLHADVDGRSARVTAGPRSWTVVAPAGVRGTRLVLRYTLDGALLRREPAPAGRYTLLLRPLTPSAGRGAGDAVVIRLQDPRVEEVYCLGAPDQLCGATTGDLHTATVPRGSPAVVIGLVTLLP